MRRVAIIGSGGAGQSTLARRLGEITGLPIAHLDREFLRWVWQFPGKTLRTIEERLARLGPGVRTVRLHSPGEVEAFLREVEADLAAT